MPIQIESRWGQIHHIEQCPEQHSLDELKKLFPNRPVCAISLQIKGLMGSTSAQGDDSGAILFKDVLCVAPDLPELAHRPTDATATSISCDFVQSHEPLSHDCVIVVDRTGTDALLAALLMSGRLEPDRCLEEAAKAAVTGTANPISDILEALVGDRDLNKSVDVLLKIWGRLTERDRLQQYLREGRFRREGSIVYTKLDEGEIDPALLPAAIFNEPDLSDAQVIALFEPIPEERGKWRICLRLGFVSQPLPLSLEIYTLHGFDYRWDRAEGTIDIQPEEFVDYLNQRLEQWERSNFPRRKMVG